MELHLPPIKPSIYQYKHIPFTESINYRHSGPIGVFCRMELNIFLLIQLRNSKKRIKCQHAESLAFVWGIHRWPLNSPHKGPVARKMFPFDDVIMQLRVGLRPCPDYLWNDNGYDAQKLLARISFEFFVSWDIEHQRYGTQACFCHSREFFNITETSKHW